MCIAGGLRVTDIVALRRTCSRLGQLLSDDNDPVWEAAFGASWPEAHPDTIARLRAPPGGDDGDDGNGDGGDGAVVPWAMACQAQRALDISNGWRLHLMRGAEVPVYCALRAAENLSVDREDLWMLEALCGRGDLVGEEVTIGPMHRRLPGLWVGC